MRFLQSHGQIIMYVVSSWYLSFTSPDGFICVKNQVVCNVMQGSTRQLGKGDQSRFFVILPGRYSCSHTYTLSSCKTDCMATPHLLHWFVSLQLALSIVSSHVVMPCFVGCSHMRLPPRWWHCKFCFSNSRPHLLAQWDQQFGEFSHSRSSHTSTYYLRKKRVFGSIYYQPLAVPFSVTLS